MDCTRLAERPARQSGEAPDVLGAQESPPEGASSDDRRMSSPLLWGFLTTSFLGVLGWFGLLFGFWQLLWLPLMSPLVGISYCITVAHSTKGMDRFLAGFAICLVAIIAIGTLLILAIYEGALV